MIFDRVLQVLSALNTLSFQHPLRIFFSLALVAVLALLIRKTFVTFTDVEQKRAFKRTVRVRRIFIFISRTVIVLLICAVFTGPYVTFPQLVHGDPKAVVIIDKTPSMSNTDTTGVSGLIDQLSTRVSTQTYTLGSSSWDSVRPYVQEGTPLLLVSDGMLSGDALAFARYAEALNASISTLALPSLEPDLGVALTVPPLAAAGVDTPISVRVDGNDAAKDLAYRVVVTIGDQVIYNVSGTGPNDYDFAIRPQVGEKIVTAKLVVSDGIGQNNIAAAAMVVANKPTVHLVTSDRNSPLAQTLSQLYTLEFSPITTDLSNVSALVIDNRAAREIDPYMSRLSDFVLRGGGLVVVGGQNSYDRGGYKGSRLESLLPVTTAKALPGAPGKLSVALILDTSSSTGTAVTTNSETSIVKLEKSLAVSVYNDLKQYDNAGVISFNNDARVIQELTSKNSQGDVPDHIARLKFAGGTSIRSGLGEAAKMLAYAEGTKYAILFSDGNSDTKSADETAAVALRNAGVKLYTVSIGENANTVHLRRLAQITGGTMFVSTEQDRFKVLFGTQTQAPKPGENNSAPISTLVPWDDHHFITQGLKLKSQVYGFNNVVPKATAQTLVVTSSNQPIVTSTFFGLGRIVSVATDDGRSWAGPMYEKDPELIARIVNFALGDAAKQQDFYVRANDPRANETMDLLVFSKRPISGSVSIGPKNVSLTETSDGEYQGSVELDQGVYSVGPRSLVVNYPREYVYPATSAAVVSAATAGKRFTTSDVDGIVQEVVASSFENSDRLRPVGSYFLLFAAIIFLIEVAIRRLTERRTA